MVSARLLLLFQVAAVLFGSAASVLVLDQNATHANIATREVPHSRLWQVSCSVNLRSLHHSTCGWLRVAWVAHILAFYNLN